MVTIRLKALWVYDRRVTLFTYEPNLVSRKDNSKWVKLVNIRANDFFAVLALKFLFRFKESSSDCVGNVNVAREQMYFEVFHN